MNFIFCEIILILACTILICLYYFDSISEAICFCSKLKEKFYSIANKDLQVIVDEFNDALYRNLESEETEIKNRR